VSPFSQLNVAATLHQVGAVVARAVAKTVARLLEILLASRVAVQPVSLFNVMPPDVLLVNATASELIERLADRGIGEFHAS
jgi:hypothetical protein